MRIPLEIRSAQHNRPETAHRTRSPSGLPPASRRTFTVAAGAALLALASSAAARSGALDVNAGAAFDGALGLEVTIAACAAPSTLNLSGSLAGAYVACQSITAGNASIAGSATFHSTAIALENGFSVSAGATFAASTNPFLGTPFAWVRDDSAASEIRYRARFRIRLDDLTLGATDQLDHLVAYSDTGETWLRLVIAYDATAGQKRLLVVARDDSGGSIDSAGYEIPLTTGWNAIDIEWLAGAGDGFVRLSLNGSPLASPTEALATLDNDTGRIGYVRWGAVSGSVSGASGSFTCDSFVSW